MSNILIVFALAYRNIWRNKKRSLITLFAVAIGAWSCVSLSSLARGLSWGMAEDTIKTFTGHLQILTPNYKDDPSIDHSFLLDQEHTRYLESGDIAAWTTRIRVPGVIMSERDSIGVLIMGVHPAEERTQSILGEVELQGEMLSDDEDTGIIIGERLAELLQTRLSKRIVLMTQNASGTLSEQGFRIVGIFKAKLQSTEQGFVFIGRKTAQRMLGIEDGVTEIALLAKNKEAIDTLSSKLAPYFPGLVIVTWQDLSPFVSALLRLQSEFIGFLFLLVFAAVSFGVVNTLLMAIFERTHEIGLLQAIGMKPGDIILQIVLESMVLVCLGGIIGNFLGGLTVWALSGSGVDISAFAEGAELLGASRVIYPVVVMKDWIQVNVIVFIMGILSSIYPAWKAASLKPVEALRATVS